MPICGTCRSANPDGFRFCGSCGAAIDIPATAGEERKVVTVLFCDLVGFTARSDEADPEDVRATLAPYHRMLRTEIERFGGTVEKFIGDAVMAIFGAPVVHEDDAERAVRAALRILETLEDSASNPSRLSVRIGINTGEVVVTLDARPAGGEGIVTGDVVNTASRLQGIAPVDGIVVGERTHAITRDLFEYEELEPVTLKGKAEPVAIWRPLAARSRFGVDVQEQHVTPFVGREDELSLLTGALRRSIRSSSCQLVTILGEPGAGKSRLTTELLAHVDELDELVSWRQGRCLPYGEGITFWALGEIVKAHAGILESDEAHDARAKLDVALRGIVPESDRGWMAERLAPLVGLSPGGSDVESDEYVGAWTGFLEAVASSGPLVLVFEDMHWGDPPLLAFIEHLAEYVTEVPLLIVCTARPELFERLPGWSAGQRNASTISLVPLSDAETSVLISALLSQAVLPAEIHQVVLDRAGGNPLYAEEFIRMLKDTGVLTPTDQGWKFRDERDISIPDSVQALISARLDTLPADRKALLQDAAVIGKVFWAGALVEMGGREESEVRSTLHELARKELVRPSRSSSVRDEPEYSFWHLLVRDVAYAQIPRSARAAKHLAAAHWIQTVGASRESDHAEVLAHHLLEVLDLAGDAADADVRDDACRYLELAGDRAFGLDAERAASLYERALELEADGTTGRIRLKLAEVLQMRGKHHQARALVEACLVEAARDGDELLTASGKILMSTIASYVDGIDASRALALEAVEILERQDDEAQLAPAYAEAALAESFGGTGDMEEAIRLSERAIELSRRLHRPDQLVRALDARGQARNYLGREYALADLEEALSLALQHGSGREAAQLYNNLAVMTWTAKGPRATLSILDRGLEFASKRRLEGWVRNMRASSIHSLFDLGRWDEADERAAMIAALADETGDRFAWAEMEVEILRLNAYRGGRNLPLRRVAQLLDETRAFGSMDLLANSLTVASIWFVLMQSPPQAREALMEIVDIASHGPAGAFEVASHVPEIGAVAAAIREPTIIEALIKLLPRTTLRHQQCGLMSEALLAETGGSTEDAVVEYRAAVSGWAQYGSVAEQARALVRLSRVLRLSDATGSATVAAEAEQLCAPMKADPVRLALIFGPDEASSADGRAG